MKNESYALFVYIALLCQIYKNIYLTYNITCDTMCEKTNVASMSRNKCRKIAKVAIYIILWYNINCD